MTQFATKNRLQNEVKYENPKTIKESFGLMKQLMAITFSTITYIRGVCPKDAYVDKNCNNLNMKLLHSAHPIANHIIKLIKSAYEAIEKQYARKVILAFLDEFGESLLETHELVFDYKLNSAGYSGTTANQVIEPGKVTPLDARRFQSSLRRMFFEIKKISKSLGQLPTAKSLQIRLEYNNDVTPADYEPPGYSAAKCTSKFPVLVSTMQLGQVDTLFHCMTMLSTSAAVPPQHSEVHLDTATASILMSEQNLGLYRRALSLCKTERWISSEILVRAIGVTSSVAESIISRFQKMGVLNTPAKGNVCGIDQNKLRDVIRTYFTKVKQHSQMSHETTSSLQSSEVLRRAMAELSPLSPDDPESPIIQSNATVCDGNELTMQVVSCVCEINQEAGDMVCCRICNTLQHKPCYAIIEKPYALEEATHCCLECHVEDDPTRQCLDIQMHALSQCKRKNLGVLRRALSVCKTERQISSGTLVRAIGVTSNIAECIIMKLQKIGVLSTAKGNECGIDQTKLRDVMPSYFSKLEQLSQRNQEINTSEHFDEDTPRSLRKRKRLFESPQNSTNKSEHFDEDTPRSLRKRKSLFELPQNSMNKYEHFDEDTPRSLRKRKSLFE